MFLDKDSFIKRVGFAIRDLRNKRGLTIEQLAIDSNMEYAQLCKIELGKVNTSIFQIYKIANAFGISVSELLIGSPETI
jgi:transcriptional regulator with XRE-family HTH domain